MGTWNGRIPAWLLGFGDFVRLVRVCPRRRKGERDAQAGCSAVIGGGGATPVAA
jgi:hypothetical protein